MSKRIAGLVAGMVAVPLALLVVGMRWKLQPVLNAVRRINRSVTNPRVMRTAGSAGTQTSVIQHIGRKSGRAYRDAGRHRADQDRLPRSDCRTERRPIGCETCSPPGRPP